MMTLRGTCLMHEWAHSSSEGACFECLGHMSSELLNNLPRKAFFNQSLYPMSTCVRHGYYAKDPLIKRTSFKFSLCRMKRNVRSSPKYVLWSSAQRSIALLLVPCFLNASLVLVSFIILVSTVTSFLTNFLTCVFWVGYLAKFSSNFFEVYWWQLVGCI